MILRRVLPSSRHLIRQLSSTRPVVVLSEEVNKEIENEVYKPRQHPGRSKIKSVQLPEEFVKAIACSCGDYPIKKIVTDSIELGNHLRFRKAPIDPEEVMETREKLLNNILAKERKHEMQCEEDSERSKQAVKDKLHFMLKKSIYHWKSINYNQYNSLVYLMARSVQEYAVLVKIFSEINERDKNFRPKSFFDFGSGTGTGTWAVKKFWKKDIFEYFNVDTSPDMNDLAQILLQGGRGNKPSELKGVFYRQFLPHQNVLYDIVLSAYSLLELPTAEQRMQTILRLWNKTGKYLILVENGSNGAFKVINEARDFILNLEKDKEDMQAHVFSPCPHEMSCPRRMANDKTPCNFEVSYHTLPFFGPVQVKKELYSYVVIAKGKRMENDEQWPRIVRDVLVRSKHTICRVCTANGKLEEMIFTASKHGKMAYQCARSSKWGDQVPVKLQPKEEDNNTNNNNENTT